MFQSFKISFTGVIAASFGFLLVNAIATVIFVAMEERISPYAVFVVMWKDYLLHFFCLPMLGGPLALLFLRQPLALPLFIIPVYGLYIAILRTQEMIQATQTAIETTARALDARDHYTYGHSTRVGATAWVIGRQMGMDALGARELEKAGLIHDIGKVAIPDAILHKGGKLSVEERIIIRGHVGAGERILSPMRPLEKLTFAAFSHHEKMDGSGYPRGLAGETIPIWARILAVADTFDALTSNRPYRKGMSDEEAIEIIEKGTGTHFDPLVVAAFLAVQNSGALSRIRFRWLEQDIQERLGQHYLAILTGS
ncbi:MAG: HD-GYP domain-containing protein [Armatimonadetes bacterium]|nr:HD-GYP domain-containing protein [Armatimonadota bacterium]